MALEGAPVPDSPRFVYVPGKVAGLPITRKQHGHRAFWRDVGSVKLEFDPNKSAANHEERKWTPGWWIPTDDKSGWMNVAVWSPSHLRLRSVTAPLFDPLRWYSVAAFQPSTPESDLRDPCDYGRTIECPIEAARQGRKTGVVMTLDRSCPARRKRCAIDRAALGASKVFYQRRPGRRVSRIIPEISEFAGVVLEIIKLAPRDAVDQRQTPAPPADGVDPRPDSDAGVILLVAVLNECRVATALLQEGPALHTDR